MHLSHKKQQYVLISNYLIVQIFALIFQPCSVRTAVTSGVDSDSEEELQESIYKVCVWDIVAKLI